jgi:hypothetical protein
MKIYSKLNDMFVCKYIFLIRASCLGYRPYMNCKMLVGVGKTFWVEEGDFENTNIQYIDEI